MPLFVGDDLLWTLVSRAAWLSVVDSRGTEIPARREPIEWQVKNGAATSANLVEFIIPALAEVAGVGYWTANDGGSCLGVRWLTEPKRSVRVSYLRFPPGSISESVRGEPADVWY